MTKFFDDVEELKDYDSMIALLNAKNVNYKTKTLGTLEQVKVITIQNEDASIFESGVKTNKGRRIVYYIENTVLLVSSYFGWQGRGEQYSTEAFIKFLSGNKEKFDEIKVLDKGRMLAADYEKIILSVFNIPTKSKKQKEKADLKKYADLVEFASEAPELFINQITSNLDGKFFIFEKNIETFFDINLAPTVVYSGNIKDQETTLKDDIFAAIKKTKAKVDLSTITQRAVRNYSMVADLKELSNMNVGIKKITANDGEHSFVIGFYIDSGLIFSPDSVETKIAGITEYVKAIENDIKGELSFIDGNFVFHKEVLKTSDDAIKEINEKLNRHFNQKELNSILKSIDDLIVKKGN